MREFPIGNEEEGQKLMHFAARLLPKAPQPFLYQMFRKKNIELNGKRASGSEVLKAGDTVRFFFSGETWEKFSGKTPGETKANVSKADGKEFQKRILFENDAVLFLNKKAGWLSQSDGSGAMDVNTLLGSYTGRDFARSTIKPSVCNRLDRNTTGILLCGKTASGLKELNDLIKTRSLRKFYQCIVFGSAVPEGEVKGYLKKDPEHNRSDFLSSPVPGAEEVLTVFKRLGKIEKDGFSLTALEAELVTGKSHQIRTTLASLGTPILGDPKYFTEKSAKASSALSVSRQLLHAARILFPKCRGTLGELSKREFSAPLPEDMLKLLKYRV